VSRRYALAAILLLVLTAGTSPALAQGGGARKLATIDELRQYPGYYHLQNVLLRGELIADVQPVKLRSGDSEMQASLLEGVPPTSGPVEVRAQLLDVGRMEPGDPRVPYSDKRDPEHWPRPGEELILMVTAVTAAQPAATPSVRALALEPWRFDGQKVTVIGQFRARNVLGDLPAAPAKDRSEFVLRSADAAIWVSGLRPRLGKVELSLDSRVDTGKWVQVSGTVARQRGLVYIQGVSIVETHAPELEPQAEETAAPPAQLLPLEVVFSSPTPDEVEVSPTTVVRVQFSRGVNPSTIAGNVRVAYAGQANGIPPQFQSSYDAATRAITIRFSQPLERFSTVRIELLDGLKAFDGGTFAPWNLTFSIGG